jgi:UTP--glucose-1-phosphate uridylyltransferase
MEIKKVVIPVAGKGTRFLPATKEIPKELIPIINKPMIQYVVEEAIHSGAEEIIFVTSKGKEAIEGHFSRNYTLENFLHDKGKYQELEMCRKIGEMVSFKTVIQEEQLGLGHAILCAEKYIKNENFGVILGDDLILSQRPVLKQLIDISKKNNDKSVIGVMEVHSDETKKYGIIDGKALEGDSKTFRLEAMIEKPEPLKAPSNLATPGRYIFSPEIFHYLRKIRPGVGGEYQLTDAINLFCKESDFFAHIFEGDRFDTGNISGYLDATIDFALRNTETREMMISIIRNKIQHYNLNI